MLHWRRDQGRVGDHVPLEELTGATTIQPPGRGVDHLPREELQAAEPANRVGDDAKFQRAESHGQRSHGGGGRKALQNVPRKWGRANNIHPKAAATQSQIQRNRRTLKPFTEMIVSRKVAVDNYFNNRDNQKKMPYQNTRVPQMYCQSHQQNLVRTSSRAKTTSTGSELLNSTSTTGVLLCNRPGPATKIAAKILQTGCPIHSATQRRGQH
jgi:hypothetical protein